MQPFAGVDTARVLVEAMKVAEANGRVIANNIANIDTPHYNQVNLDFQATLHQAIERRGRVNLRMTRPQHFDMERFRPVVERGAILAKNDYNKVDLEDQMARLSENTGRYTTYGSLLAKRFQVAKAMLNDLR